MWLAWDHPGSSSWPVLEEQPPHPAAMASQDWLEEIVERLRIRLSDLTGPMVVGHGDWEAQNMVWREDGSGLVVHDWDSLAYRPEPAIVGAAAATFASGGQPTLAPIDVSARFMDTYQRQVKRSFTKFEAEIAWAAGLWLAAHNARMELLYGEPRLVHFRIAEEAAERLRRAGA
jgi:Ser/Thr protein kinase RdoA (MazF antagonist)